MYLLRQKMWLKRRPKASDTAGLAIGVIGLQRSSESLPASYGEEIHIASLYDQLAIGRTPGRWRVEGKGVAPGIQTVDLFPIGGKRESLTPLPG